jgi:hypothetical protein
VEYLGIVFVGSAYVRNSDRVAHDRERRELLIKCAATSLNSKLISHQKDFFAPIVVDAVLSLDEDLSLDMIGVKKIPGGALEVRDEILRKKVPCKVPNPDPLFTGFFPCEGCSF